MNFGEAGEYCIGEIGSCLSVHVSRFKERERETVLGFSTIDVLYCSRSGRHEVDGTVRAVNKSNWESSVNQWTTELELGMLADIDKDGQ